MKFSLVLGITVLLSLVSLSIAGGGDGAVAPFFESPFAQGDFDESRPTFEPVPGAEVSISGVGTKHIISDFGGIDELDFLIGFINPVIFRKIGDPRDELLPLCPDIEKIVNKVEGTFDQEDFENMCSEVENSAEQCKGSDDACSDIKKIAEGGQAAMCPPDEARFFNACKTRIQNQLANADALGRVECGQLWDRHTEPFFEEQCTPGETEVSESTEEDVETEQAAVVQECPEPFKPFTCSGGSPALASGQSYPFDHNDLICELYTCPNQTVTNATVAEECPGPPSCNVGGPVLSGSFQKATGQICPAYECVQPANSTTVAVTASPAVISGLAVEASSGVAVASSGGVCTKEGFMDYCVNEFKKKVQNANNNADEDCGAEAREFTDYLLGEYCEEDEVGDPYERCVEQTERGCDKLNSVFDKCESVANREGLHEVLERKVKVECARLALSMQGGEFENAVSSLENLEIEAASREDVAQLSATRDQIVLTAEELKRLKQEIRADVLRDLLTLLGLNTARLEVAQKQKREIESLDIVRGSVQDMCGKVTDDSKARCDALLESLDEKIAGLKREAADNEVKGSGILGIIKRIFSGK